MKFEDITKNYVKKHGNRVKPSKKIKPEEIRDMECPTCGELFKIVIRGPRAGYGKCVCGFTVMM